MDPNQNKKPDYGQDNASARNSQNNIPPNLPAAPEEKPKTTPPTKEAPTQDPQKNFPSLEEQIATTNEIDHNSSPPPPAPALKPSPIHAPTTPASGPASQKNVLPKEAEARGYGKTNVKPLRTYEQDVAEARHKTGNETVTKPVQKETEKSVVLQKNATAKGDELRKRAIEQELAESGIKPTSVVKEKQPEEKTSISPIKTFRNDATNEVKKSDLSVISIATAQNKKRMVTNHEKPEKRESNFIRNLSIVIVSIVLIGSGSGLAWFFYQKALEGRAVTPEEEISSLVFADSQIEVNVTGIRTNLLINSDSKVQSGTNPFSSNTVIHLYHTETSFGGSKLISAQEFLSRVNPNIPDRLIRSVEKEYMLGRHVTGNQNSPFLIFKTDSFESTFASMLLWEETMQRDLAPYFGEALGDLTASLVTTGTSTSNASVIIPRVFQDVIIKNIDTRLLRDNSGKISLLYSFPNANTLIIATNENTFFEVFRRLTTSR